MRIMIDSNVIISAVLFPESKPTKVIRSVTEDHNLVLCSHIIEELHQIFKKNLEERAIYLISF